MTLLHTQNPDRPVRYYANGKRVSRDRFDEIKFGRNLDTFLTIRKGATYFHYCRAS